MIDLLFSRVCRYSAAALANRYRVSRNSNLSCEEYSVINVETGKEICVGSFDMCTNVVKELHDSSMKGIYTAARKASKYF